MYSILLCPIVWFGHTIFLAGLLFGREIGWIGQTRDDHAVPLALALRNLWPHTLLGCAALGLAGDHAAGAIPYALFLAAGPALAVPFAMITAWPAVRKFCCADRHRPVARGDRQAGGAARPGVAGDRDGGAIAAAKFGLRRCSKASGPRAALFGRFAFITATGRAPRQWIGSTAAL